MVEKLFTDRWPSPRDRVLDPGCGTGAFIEAILQWCRERAIAPPSITGLDSDLTLIHQARRQIGDHATITLTDADFLVGDFDTFDFIIGNPPYVRLERLSRDERAFYRTNFRSAFNRFDLYMLFFEKALGSLAAHGRLVFITPEKFEYTLTATPLRRIMAQYHVEEIHHLDEDAFEGLVTYPTITTINVNRKGPARVIHRDGSSTTVHLPSDGSPWISAINGWTQRIQAELTLKDICLRISCGVATGADRTFVIPKDTVPDALQTYAHPAVSGRDLTPRGVQVSDAMLIPYDTFGALLPEKKLAPLKRHLSPYKDDLLSRHCVTSGRRQWYAFHENPPMTDMLRPKILCKDIAKEPRFWADEEGLIVPRHSVYYIVPANPQVLPELLEYLNTEEAAAWLLAHCQRAANGFIRLQSRALKRLPIPQFEDK